MDSIAVDSIAMCFLAMDFLAVDSLAVGFLAVGFLAVDSIAAVYPPPCFEHYKFWQVAMKYCSIVALINSSE